MKSKTSTYTLIALILGAVCGLVLPEFVQAISFIGTIYINLLKFLIGPIVFTSITVTIFNSSRNNSKLVIKAVVLFAIMFIATFLLTSGVVVLLDPASGFSFEGSEYTSTIQEFSITDIIVNLFPSNLVTMFANTQLFAIILFSYALGYCLTKVEKGEKVAEDITVIRNALYQILQYIMYVTPFAVFALIGNTVAQYGTVTLTVGFKYILTAYIAGILTLIFIMILPVLVLTKMKPLDFLKKVYRIWMITLTTCSSAATLPYTMKLCKEDLNIPDEVTDVVVPLGCTIHMCGGAVSFALLGLFCSSLFGIPVTLPRYLMMLVSALLINMSAPGIPNGGVVIGASYLELLTIPLNFIGFYSGIYKVLDMLYTTLNVTGDITANVILSHQKH